MLNSKIIDESQKNNMEEKQYPSNYSYYEYKYTKKKLDSKKINKTINNTLQIDLKYSTLNTDEKKFKPITYSNYNLTKNNIKNIEDKNSNDKYSTKNTPLHKIANEFHYIKINKNKINTLVTSASDNNKGNMVLNNIYNKINSKLINEYNNNYKNTYIKEKCHPRTPLINPSLQMNNIPVRNPMNTNYSQNNKNIKNSTKINLPFKSYDNSEKLVFTHTKNNIKNLSYKQKFDTVKNSKKNAKSNEPKRLTVEKTPNLTKEIKIKNFIKMNNIIDKQEKYNNTVTITINDTNEHKNIIKKLNFNSDAKSIIKEHINNYTEIMSLKQNKNKSKDKLDSFDGKKRNIINGIKILDYKKLKDLSFPKNNILKNIFYKNKINEIKNKHLINKTENKYRKLKLKNYIENGDNTKEKEKMNYDNYTEPSNGFRNIFKESIKSINNNKGNLGKRIIIKGRIITKKDINKTPNYQSNTEVNKNENSYFIMNNDKNTSIEKIFDHKNKTKTDISYNSNIINNKPIINNMPPDSNILLKKANIEINKSKNTNKINKNIFNSLSINKIDHSKYNYYSNLAKLTINENKKNFRQKSYNNISELPIHVSRIDEISKKNEKISDKRDDNWDKNQFKGMRKKTYDPGRRGRKNIQNKNSKKYKNFEFFEEQFSSDIFVKNSEGISLAGKNSQGNKKINQDTFVIERNINGILNFNIFGVLDGHGDHGHFVSKFVKRYVIHRIKNHPLIKRLDEPKEIYHQLKLKGFDIISKIFIEADAQIQKEKFDCIRSGTTIVLVIQLEEHIICANTGDSRAIAIYDEKNEDNLANSKIFHLSYDCKPNLPNEKRRIDESGGVVEKAYYANNTNDEYIPYRVWARGENYPGLAMSRSIGDMDAKKVGVIPNPQFVEYTLDNSSKYILICSDGIWEFMSNEEAMQIANKYYLRNDPIGLCHELSQSSIKLWKEREIVIDDITVLVIFF